MRVIWKGSAWGRKLPFVPFEAPTVKQALLRAQQLIGLAEVERRTPTFVVLRGPVGRAAISREVRFDTTRPSKSRSTISEGS